MYAYRFVFGQTETQFNNGVPDSAYITVGSFVKGTNSITIILMSPPTLTADSTANTVGNAVDITFTDDTTWRAASPTVKVGTTTVTGATWAAGTLTIPASYFTSATDYTITVSASGYADATVTQTMSAASSLTPPTLIADINRNSVGNDIVTTFADDATWRAIPPTVSVEPQLSPMLHGQREHLQSLQAILHRQETII